MSKDGISIDPAKIKVFTDWSVPNNVIDIRPFMEITRYYQKLIEFFSKIAYPITSLRNKGKKFQWTEKYMESFDKLKYMLTTYPILNIINPFKDFIVCIDACINTRKLRHSL